MTHDEIQQLAALDAIQAASAEELEELRIHLASCDECRQAAEEFDEAAALMALSVEPVMPPPHVRAVLLEEMADGGRAVTVERPLPSSAPNWWLAVAAAAVLLLGLWGFTEMRVRAIREETLALRATVDQLSAEKKLLSESVASLSASTRTIQLMGQSVAPTASARVFLDPSQRRAFVFFHGLPPNTADKSYQLWIIRADEVKPQSAGVFSVDKNGDASLVVQNLPLDTVIKALAVTLEPKGGVEAPTGEKFLVGSS